MSTEFVYSALLDIAPLVLIASLTVTGVVLITGAGFFTYKGRFGWDKATERKRKAQAMLVCGSLLVVVAIAWETPFVCLGIFPLFILVWVVG